MTQTQIWSPIIRKDLKFQTVFFPSILNQRKNNQFFGVKLSGRLLNTSNFDF